MSELGESMTLQQIATKSGLASRGHAHDLASGKQKTVGYEVGLRLVSLHKKIARKNQNETCT